MADWLFSTGRLGDPNGSKSIGNQLLDYTGIIPEIKLPDRFQLAAELEHFVESLPLNQVILLTYMDFVVMQLYYCSNPFDNSLIFALAGIRGRLPTKCSNFVANWSLSGKSISDMILV